MPRCFGYVLVCFSLYVLSLFLKPTVAEAHSLHKQTLYEQKAIEIALDHFIKTKQWQRADELFQASLLTPYYSERFYELGVILLVHQNRQNEARKLLALARNLYPEHLSFMSSHALLLAQAGQCHRASNLWDTYRASLPFPISNKEAIIFNQYCGTDVHHVQSIASHAERLSRGDMPPGSDEIIAIKGSYIYDLCTILPEVCPDDLRFSVASKTSRKLSVKAQYNAQTSKRYNWRHSAEVGFQMSHELAGYNGYNGQLHAQWHYRLRQNKHLSVGLGIAKSYLPQFDDDSAVSQRTTFTSLSYHEQLSRKWRSQILFRHSAHDIRRPTTNDTSHSNQNSYSIYYQPTPLIEIGATAISGSAKPEHDDDKGKSSRQGYDLSLAYRSMQKFSVSLHYVRAKTKYQNTLPYLTAPHNMVETRYYLRVAKPLSRYFNIAPFLQIHKQIYRSSNLSQHGSHTSATIGLSYQL